MGRGGVSPVRKLEEVLSNGLRICAGTQAEFDEDRAPIALVGEQCPSCDRGDVIAIAVYQWADDRGAARSRR